MRAVDTGTTGLLLCQTSMQKWLSRHAAPSAVEAPRLSLGATLVRDDPYPGFFNEQMAYNKDLARPSQARRPQGRCRQVAQRTKREKTQKYMQKIGKKRNMHIDFVPRGQGEGLEERRASAGGEKRAKMQVKPMKL